MLFRKSFAAQQAHAYYGNSSLAEDPRPENYNTNTRMHTEAPAHYNEAEPINAQRLAPGELIAETARVGDKLNTSTTANTPKETSHEQDQNELYTMTKAKHHQPHHPH